MYPPHQELTHAKNAIGETRARSRAITIFVHDGRQLNFSGTQAQINLSVQKASGLVAESNDLEDRNRDLYCHSGV